MKKPRYYNRQFLNLEGFHAGAYLLFEIEDSTTRESSYAGSPRVTLRIADCSRHIDLEIDMDTEEERTNSFHKLDLLISSLVDLREACRVEWELHEDREKNKLIKEPAAKKTLRQLREELRVENGLDGTGDPEEETAVP